MLASWKLVARLRLLAGVAGIGLLATLVAAAGGCQTADRGVVYVSEQDGNAEIYIVDPESQTASPLLTLNASTESGPRWSPDGKYIAFVSSQSGKLDIKVVAAGEGQSAPTLDLHPSGDGEGNQESPVWNAQSDKLAYVSDQDGHADVYVSPLPTSENVQTAPVRITSADTDEFLGDWSPDGQWLVFSRRGGPDTQGLWLRNPNGVNLFRLTSENDLAPTWSPDGDAIAFVRRSPAQNQEANRDIYLLRPEDGDDWRSPLKAIPLVSSPAPDHSPAWAPDGDTLVYVTERDGNPEIYLLATDKDDPPLRLTTNEAADSHPVWSPGGNRIAFVSNIHGQTEIFVMDSDGSNQQRLTHNDAPDHSPDW